MLHVQYSSKLNATQPVCLQPIPNSVVLTYYCFITGDTRGRTLEPLHLPQGVRRTYHCLTRSSDLPVMASPAVLPLCLSNLAWVYLLGRIQLQGSPQNVAFSFLASVDQQGGLESCWMMLHELFCIICRACTWKWRLNLWKVDSPCKEKRDEDRVWETLQVSWENETTGSEYKCQCFYLESGIPVHGGWHCWVGVAAVPCLSPWHGPDLSKREAVLGSWFLSY